mgnify:CR=1 FL=1
MTSHIEHELSIPEELLLLVLDDESGGGRSDLALGGGVLAELVFRGVVVVEQHGRTNEVVVAGANAAIDHELLAECLEDVRASSKQRNAAHWVNKFSTKKDLKARVATPLVERGVLDERKRKLLFFEFTQYPETNPVPEAELTERLARGGLQAGLLFSHDPLSDEILLDLVSPLATKRGAVAHLAEALSLEEHEVLFAGDSGNDMDALLSDFPAVLVGNADAETRRQVLAGVRAGGRADRLHQARAPYAAGILEGLEHFAALTPPPWTER